MEKSMAVEETMDVQNQQTETNEDIIARLDEGIKAPQENVEGLIESPR